MKKKFLALFFLSYHLFYESLTLGCSSPPLAAYNDPTFIDLSFSVNWHPEYHSTHRFLLLLNHFIPGQVDKNNQVSSVLTLEAEKTYVDEAQKLLKAKGIDSPALISTTKEKTWYPSYKSVCGENLHLPALAFLNSVLSDQLSAPNYEKLAQLRQQVFNFCFEMPEEQKKQSIDTFLNLLKPLAQDPKLAAYGQYLEASANFYTEQWEPALTLFALLAQDPAANPWIQETALYMQVRLQKNIAQKVWDGYSNPQQQVKQDDLAQAKNLVTLYLKKYPQGLYSHDVRELDRRFAYLEGNQDELNRLLREKINEVLMNSKDLNFIYNYFIEFKNFFRGSVDILQDHPLLISYFLLYSVPFPADALTKLKMRKNDFNLYPHLYDFIVAEILSQNKQHANLLEQTASIPITRNSLPVAIAVLRARSLEALQKKPESLSLWKKINEVHQDDFLQIELAALYAKDKNWLGLVKEPLLKNPKVIQNFLQFAGTTDEELESLLLKSDNGSTKDFIAQELLRRYLLTQRFSSMADVFQKHSNVLKYQDIKHNVISLVKNPQDADSLLALGLFIIKNYITPDSHEYSSTQWNGLDEISPYCSECTSYAERTVMYKTAYDFFENAEKIYATNETKSQKEAEVLHYLIGCFKVGESSKKCQWLKTYENVSKKRFHQLHKKYPTSDWTKKTPYYY